MVLFFNLKKLEKLTNCDPAYIVEAMYMLHKNIRFPRTKLDRYKPLNIGAGNSFLLYPEGLLEKCKVDVIYKAQYIRLAGRRDYLNYKITKHKYLDCGLFPDLNEDAIKTNTLINIRNNKLYFKYEEN